MKFLTELKTMIKDIFSVEDNDKKFSNSILKNPDKKRIKESAYSYIYAIGNLTNKNEEQQFYKRIKQTSEAYKTNGLYGRIIDAIIDNLIGREIEILSIDEQQQTIINNFIDLNDFNYLISELVETLVLKGEVLIVFSQAPNGYLIFNNFYSDEIKSVEFDGIKPKKVTLQLTDETGLNYDEEIQLIENPFVDLAALRLSKNSKIAFYFRLTGLNERGLPVALKSFEWAERHAELLRFIDEFLKANVFMLDITTKGFSDEQLNELEQVEYQRQGELYSIRVHDESVEYNYKSPNINTTGLDFLEERLRHEALGAMGLGAHWFASGEDINRATAQEMKEPFERYMKRLRERLKRQIKRIFITQLILQGITEPSVNIKISVLDNSIFEAMGAIAQFANSSDKLILTGILTVDQARQILNTIFKEFSINIEEEEENNTSNIEDLEDINDE